jgi:hypothetical protein
MFVSTQFFHTKGLISGATLTRLPIFVFEDL